VRAPKLVSGQRSVVSFERGSARISLPAVLRYRPDELRPIYLLSNTGRRWTVRADWSAALIVGLLVLAVGGELVFFGALMWAWIGGGR